MTRKHAWGIAAISACLAPLFAAVPNWIPDITFKATSLAGWHTLGQADWRVQNGEVIGTVRQGGYGGWLALDRSYQDVALYANFRCGAGCQTGILLRAEKTAEGMKGIYVSLTEGDMACYRVTLDADGKELTREKLPPAPTSPRILPPANPAGGAGAGGRRGGGAAGRGAFGGAGGAARGGGGGRAAAPVADYPFTQPKPGARSADWNSVEVMIDENSVRAWVNDIGEATIGRAEEEDGRFGPIALYVGGSGEVRFKDIAYKDLATRNAPAEKVSSRFRMQRLDEFYYAWSAAAADFNHDGILDVVAGPWLYFGPDFTKSREILPAHTWNPSTEYANDCMLEIAYDFTGDGWPDILCGASLYVNPKGDSRRWDKYQVLPGIGSEVWTTADIDGDGKPEVVFMSRAEGMVWAKPDPANPTGQWKIHSVSGPGYGIQHGIGAGDINGDGRPDMLNVFGWWENPGPGGKEPWKYHPVAFGRYERDNLGSGGGSAAGNVSLGNGISMMAGGALMPVYDVNGDGLNDVVTAISAHGFGLSWFEQKRDAAGNISFVEHPIMKDYSDAAKNAGGVTFSEAHAMTSADVDGDGVTDIVVGKRYWSHEDSLHDPDAYGAPVLYWYRTVRNPKAPGGAEFVPDLIHNRSGVGSNVLAVDLNHDGAMDIVTATDRGTFIFWGKPKAHATTAAGARK
ncbi:MAG TPA: FG-GAP-like repeat-containing protein [Bryobacteraceae bacterium]|nr:FG-GAP-like repeat-containing protein [Bryobacteraceae bacterium]